jgi:hypothetical protein
VGTVPILTMIHRESLLQVFRKHFDRGALAA